MRKAIILALVFILLLNGCRDPDALYHETPEHYLFGAVITNISDQTPSVIAYNESAFAIHRYNYDLPGENPFHYLYGEWLVMPGQDFAGSGSSRASAPTTKIYYLDMVSPSNYPVTEYQDYAQYQGFAHRGIMSIGYRPNSSIQMQLFTDWVRIQNGVQRNFTMMGDSFLLPSFHVAQDRYGQEGYDDFGQDHLYQLRTKDGSAMAERVLTRSNNYVTKEETTLPLPIMEMTVNGTANYSTELRNAYDEWWSNFSMPLQGDGHYRIEIQMPFGLPIFNQTNITVEFVKSGNNPIDIPKMLELDAPQRFTPGAPYRIRTRMGNASSLMMRYNDGSGWQAANTTTEGAWTVINITPAPQSENISLSISARNGSTNITYNITPVALSARPMDLTIQVRPQNISPGMTARINGTCGGDSCKGLLLNITVGNTSRWVMTDDNETRPGTYALNWTMPPDYNASTFQISAAFAGAGRYLPASAVLDTNTTKLGHDILLQNFSVAQADGLQQRIVSVVVWNSGLATETAVPVRLIVNGVTVSSTAVTLSPRQSRALNLTWTPSQYGTHNITVVADLPSDELPENNMVQTATVLGVDLYAGLSYLNYLVANTSNPLTLWTFPEYTSIMHNVTIAAYAAESYEDGEGNSLTERKGFLNNTTFVAARALNDTWATITISNNNTTLFNGTAKLGQPIPAGGGNVLVPTWMTSDTAGYTIGDYHLITNQTLRVKSFAETTFNYAPQQPGMVSMIVIADSPQEYDFSNNLQMYHLPVKDAGPDIYPWYLQTVPRPALINQSNLLNLTVQNQGNQASKESTVIINLLNQTARVCLDNGESTTIDIDGTNHTVALFSTELVGAWTYRGIVRINTTPTQETQTAYYAQLVPVTSTSSLLFTDMGDAGGCADIVRNTTVGTRQLQPIGARKNGNVVMPWTPSKAGEHKFHINISTATDVDLSNNFYWIGINAKRDGPDLETYIDLPYPQIYAQGTTREGRIYIFNEGSQNATNVTADVYSFIPAQQHSLFTNSTSTITANGETFELSAQSAEDHMIINVTGKNSTIPLYPEQAVMLSNSTAILYVSKEGTADDWQLIFEAGNVSKIATLSRATLEKEGVWAPAFNVSFSQRGRQYVLAHARPAEEDSVPSSNFRSFAVSVATPGNDIRILSVDAGIVRVGDVNPISVRLQNLGAATAEDMRVTLRANGEIIGDDTIDLYALDEMVMHFGWIPAAAGEYNLSVTATAANDTNLSDNTYSMMVPVRAMQGTLLWIHDGTGKAQQRFIQTDQLEVNVTGAAYHELLNIEPALASSSTIQEHMCSAIFGNARLGARSELWTQHLLGAENTLLLCADKPSWSSESQETQLSYIISDATGPYTTIDLIGCKRWNFTTRSCASGWETLEQNVTVSRQYGMKWVSLTVQHDHDAIALRKTDTALPNITIHAPGQGAIIQSSAVTINYTIHDSTFANASLRLDNGTVQNISAQGTITLANLTPGLHRATILALDGNGNAAERTVSFVIWQPLNITQLASRMGAMTNSSALIVRNGTAVSAANITDLLTLTLSASNASATVPGFNASVAAWSAQFTLSTNASAATAIGHRAGGTLAHVLVFRNFSHFINESALPSGVTVTFPGRHDGLKPVFIEDDDGAKIRVLEPCPGAVPPAAVRSASQACYVANATALTAYLPHFSGAGLINDTQGPNITINTPAASESDSEATLDVVVFEASPRPEMCSYRLMQNSTTLRQAILQLAQDGTTFTNTTRLSGLQNGGYTITVECSDADNLTMSSTAVFMVADTTAPRITAQASQRQSGSSTAVLLEVNSSEHVTCRYGNSLVDPLPNQLGAGLALKQSATQEFTASQQIKYYVACTDINNVSSGMMLLDVNVQTAQPSYGGGGGKGAPPNATPYFSSNGSFRNMQANKEYHLQGNGSVQRISIVAAKAYRDVKFTVHNASSTPDIPEFTIIGGFMIASQPDIELASAQVTFVVPLGANASEITLFSREGGVWRPVKAKALYPQGDNMVYAAEISSLGLHYIGIKAAPQSAPTAMAVKDPQLPQAPTLAAPSPIAERTTWPWIVAAAVLGLIIAGTLALRRHSAPPSVALDLPDAYPQLSGYISDCRARGASDERIIAELRTAGWPEGAVQEELKAATRRRSAVAQEHAKLAEYVSACRERNLGDEQIAAMLRSAGWRDDVIAKELKR